MLTNQFVSSALTINPSAFYSGKLPFEGVAGYLYGNVLDGQLNLQQYINPEDEIVTTLAGQLNRVEDIYALAFQWTYVSDEILNKTAEKWMTPREFLTETSRYESNPTRGIPAGDCEEKANTLVSLLRAWGIPPEEVRVVLGLIDTKKGRTGHAWVELLRGDRWLTLDPSLGPYWSEEANRLVIRRYIPFDYYASRDYDAIAIHCYYNDKFYLIPGDRLFNNAPAVWFN